MTDPSTSSGLPPRTAAALAYVAGPISGGLILLAESRNADVRFHAFQSVIALGGLVALMCLGYVLAVVSLFVSAGTVALFVRAIDGDLDRAPRGRRSVHLEGEPRRPLETAAGGRLGRARRRPRSTGHGTRGSDRRGYDSFRIGRG